MSVVGMLYRRIEDAVVAALPLDDDYGYMSRRKAVRNMPCWGREGKSLLRVGSNVLRNNSSWNHLLMNWKSHRIEDQGPVMSAVNDAN